MQTSSDALEVVSQGEKSHPVLRQTLMTFHQPLKSREMGRVPGDHSSCLQLSHWLPQASPQAQGDWKELQLRGALDLCQHWMKGIICNHCTVSTVVSGEQRTSLQQKRQREGLQ